MHAIISSCHAEYFMYYTLPKFFILLTCSFQLYKHVFAIRVEKSVDPDQMAHKKPADVDRQCFQKG